MAWKEIDLGKWAREMKVDLLEIDQKLKLREMIVKLRKQQGLTQEDLAQQVGISRTRIAQIENGIKIHKMSFDVLLRVLQGLGYRYRISAKKAA